MDIARLLESTGLARILADPFLLIDAGAASASVFLFLSTLALAVLTCRAAASAKRARQEALDFAVEVRHLTAQVEKATSRRAAAVSEEPAMELSESDRIEAQNDPDFAPNAEQTLEAAKSASVPSALLRMSRRRR